MPLYIVDIQSLSNQALVVKLHVPEKGDKILIFLYLGEGIRSLRQQVICIFRMDVKPLDTGEKWIFLETSNLEPKGDNPAQSLPMSRLFPPLQRSEIPTKQGCPPRVAQD